jgi:hypothetical protein
MSKMGWEHAKQSPMLDHDEEAYKKYWTCEICKRDTSKVEYDYLVSHNLHLECALKVELKDMKSDEKKCPYCEAGL